MASATTNSTDVTPPKPGRRGCCGSSGTDAGHASLRAFVAAHAPSTPRPVFGSPAPLGSTPAHSSSTHSNPSVPPSPSWSHLPRDRQQPVPLFGKPCAPLDLPQLSQASGAGSAEIASKTSGERASGGGGDAATTLRRGRSSPVLPPATVFGTRAPRMPRRPSAAAPKRPREAPAVDDVAALLAQCQAVEADDDVSRAAELLACWRVPGKRPRTASEVFPVAGKPPGLSLLKKSDSSGGGDDNVGSSNGSSRGEGGDSDRVSGGDDIGEGAGVSDSSKLSARSELQASRKRTGAVPEGNVAAGADTAAGVPVVRPGGASEDDDCELSFLVTRCDIDSRADSGFMPYCA